jgi:hypothetical protein
LGTEWGGVSWSRDWAAARGVSERKTKARLSERLGGWRTGRVLLLAWWLRRPEKPGWGWRDTGWRRRRARDRDREGQGRGEEKLSSVHGARAQSNGGPARSAQAITGTATGTRRAEPRPPAFFRAAPARGPRPKPRRRVPSLSCLGPNPWPNNTAAARRRAAFFGPMQRVLPGRHSVQCRQYV